MKDETNIQHMSELQGEFFRKHKGLVLHASRGLCTWLDRDELLQIGNIALAKAAQCYKVSRGLRFSSYAYTAIKREIIKEGSLARPGFSLKGSRPEELFRKIRQYVHANAAVPTLAQFRDLLNPTCTVRDDTLEALLMLATKGIGSCDHETQTRSNDKALDRPGGVHFTETRYELVDKRLLVEDLLKSLKPKERILLNKIFGLNGTLPLAQIEIAAAAGTSRQAVQIRYRRILHKLQLWSAHKGW